MRDEIPGRRVPSAIAGQSFYGLNSGAKRSLDRSYLALAEATGHDVLPLHQVTAIGRGDGGRPTSLVELVLPPHINAALGASGPPGAFANYASLGIPPALGTFTYDSAADVVRVNWAAPDDPRLASFLGAAQRTMSILDERNGSVTLGINPVVSAHPLGGAVMGKACDLDGRLKNHPGLYVVDGALIEGSTGLANPSFTVAALAERCMDRIVPALHSGGV